LRFDACENLYYMWMLKYNTVIFLVYDFQEFPKPFITFGVLSIGIVII